jgi:nucleoside phosphorylase/CheY-like chemotaxis protein
MLKILVIEDDGDKLRRVMNCLKGSDETSAHSIHNARDAADAKRRMRDQRYDLVVLDMALPNHSDQPPTPYGGLSLLEDILNHDVYKTPRHIVGLTAYPDILEVAQPHFAENLLHIIFYDPTSEEWIEQLQRKLRHIELAERSSPESLEYRTHLCIVTALHDPELTAILKLNWSWTMFELPNDGTVYYRGHFSRGGETREVIAATMARMGMISAAVLSMKMIAAFRPKYLAIAGILAGVRDQCELGDIVAADLGWDYGSGKLRTENGMTKLAAAPYQIALDSSILCKLHLLKKDATALNEIRLAWPGSTSRSTLQMHIGPVASGAAVISSCELMEVVKQQHRKVVGVEMETYGVFAAASESPLPRPFPFSIKSVSDFGEQDKHDDCQNYAAFTSSNALKTFAERYL